MSTHPPAPLVTFTCQPNSHSFDERQIALTEQLKVGRSVARARPASSNAIFDCKVLSRNHAIIWYEADKFWIKDTKSSNGTFVNSHRLSKGSEESAPRQLFSGDIIQFGVDVVENTTTHGCIIAQMSLFHPDGTEVRRKEEDYKMNENSANGSYNNLSQEQIYQLAQYLQEALYREQTLEKKLESLQKSLTLSEEASASGWQVLLNEEHLLSKLDLLESQLQVYVKNYSDDNLRAEASRAYEERYQIERQCQTAIERLLEEKAVTQRKEALLESRLASFELENAIIKRKYEEQVELLSEQKAESEKANQDSHDAEECRVKFAELDDVRVKLENRLHELQNKSDDYRFSASTEEKETQSQDSQSDYESLHNFVGIVPSADNVTNLADEHYKHLQDEFIKMEEALDAISTNGLDYFEIEKLISSFNTISEYPPVNDAMVKLESIFKKVLKIKFDNQQSLPCTDLDAPGSDEKSICPSYKEESCQYDNDSEIRSALVQEIEDLKVKLANQVNTALELEKNLISQKDHSSKLEHELVALQKDLLARQSLSYSDSSTLTDGLTSSLMSSSIHTQVSDEDISSAPQIRESESNPSAPDLDQLRSECDRLREVVAWIEKELKSTRAEHEEMKAAYEDCLGECDKLKQQQTTNNSQFNPPDEPVVELTRRCKEQEIELKELRDLHSLQLRALSSRARFFSVCTVLPLMVVLAAIMIGFYWKLA